MVGDNRPLKDYVVPTDEQQYCSLVHHPKGANNFEIKPPLIGMVYQN